MADRNALTTPAARAIYHSMKDVERDIIDRWTSRGIKLAEAVRQLLNDLEDAAEEDGNG